MARGARLTLRWGVALFAFTLASGSVLAQDGDAVSAVPTASMAPGQSMAPTGQPEPGLHVRDAWARESLLVDLASAAYMVIDNGTAVDDALVGAWSLAATVTEIHQTSLAEDGSMAMAPVAEVPIPAQGSAILEPGGYHVMLVGLVAPLMQGTHIEVTLEFASAEDVTLSVPVQAASPMGDMGGMDGGEGNVAHDGHAADPSSS